MAVGGPNACAIFSASGVGKIRCWGNGGSNAVTGTSATVGQTPSSMTVLPFLAFSDATVSASSISLGFRVGCAVFTNGSLRCWGQRVSGGLGFYSAATGLVAPSAAAAVNLGTGLVPKDVTCNPNAPYCCVITTAGALKCFGKCTNVVVLGYCLGTNTAWDGDNNLTQMSSLPPVAFPAGAGAVAKVGLNRMSVESTNVDITAVLFADGRIRVFGEIGTTGLGGYNMAPGIWGGTATSSTSLLPIVDFGPAAGPAVDIAIGFTAACALFSAGTIRCWGGAEGPFDFGPNAMTLSQMTLIPPVNPFPATPRSIGIGTYTFTATFDTGFTAVTFNFWGQSSATRGSGGGRSVMPVSLVPSVAGLVTLSPVGTKPSIALSHHGAYGAATCAIRSSDSKVVCWGNSLQDFIVTYAFKSTFELPESNTGGLFIPVSAFPTTDVANLAFAATQLYSYSGGDQGSGGGVVCAKLSGTNGHACWGKNYLSATPTTQSCQLFYNGGSSLTKSPSTPVTVLTPQGCTLCCCSNTWPSTPEPWFDLSVGYEHSCGIYTSSSSRKMVFCWGGNFNQFGELGITPVDASQLGCDAGVNIRAGLFIVAETYQAVSVHAGYKRTCAIFSSYPGYVNMVKCWGLNEAGETFNSDVGGPNYQGMGFALASSSLGITAMANLPDPPGIDTHWKALSVSMGRAHTCLLMIKMPSNNYRDAACFGRGLNFRLGRGASETDITLPLWNGQGLWEEVGSFIVVASFSVVRGVSAGYDHTCLLLQLDVSPAQLDTLCFGSNSYGQTGSILGANVDVPFLSNSVQTQWSLPMGNYVVAVVAGRFNTCVQTNFNKVICIGANHAGQLGQGGGASDVRAIYHLGSYATADVAIPDGCTTTSSTSLASLSVPASLQFAPSFAPATSSYAVVMPASLSSFTAVATSSGGGMVWFEDNLSAASTPAAVLDLQGACTASPGIATFSGALPLEGYTANITVGVVDSQRRGPLPAPVTSYTVTVRRAYSDSALGNLADSLSSVVTGPADPRVFRVPFTVTAVPPVTASCNATTRCKVSLAGSALTLTSVTGTLPPLALGPNVFPLQVQPEDGPLVSYDFTVVRQDNNADLASLVDSAGLIAGLFLPATTLYAISLPSAVPSLSSLIARCASTTCSIAATGAAAGSGTGGLDLVNILVPAGGAAVAVSIAVTSEDATAVKTTVLRLRRMLADATATFADSAAGAPFLPLATTAATITPTCGDPAGCSVTVAGVGGSGANATAAAFSVTTTSGVPVTVPLSPGPNAFTCTVKAEDPAVPARTYTVNIRRGPFPSTDSTLVSVVEPASNTSARISGTLVTVGFVQAAPPNPTPDLTLALTCRAPLPSPCAITVPAGSGATCTCPPGSRTCLLTVAAPATGQSVRATVAAEDPLAGVTPYIIALVGAPVVLSVNPIFAPASAAAVITVAGKDFGNTASEFGGLMTAGVPCLLSVWVSPVTARCLGIAASRVTAGAPALVTASTLAAGAGASSTTVFIVPHPPNPSLAPAITRVLPQYAEIGAGVTLTLTGRNLVSLPSPTLVAVGDLTCSVLAATATATSLACEIRAPGASAPALVSVSVATQDGLYVPAAPDFSFTPVASKDIFVVNRPSTSTSMDLPFTREDDPSTAVVILLSLSVNVSSYLSVIAVVDPPSEARILNPTASFPVGSPANSTANFTVVGIPDRQRDGARAYSVSFEVSSGDPLLDRAHIPPVTLINRDSRPLGLAISPGVAPLLGGTTATVAGLNFDPDSTFLLGGYPCRNVSVVSQELAVVVVPGSPSGAEGYAALQALPGASSSGGANDNSSSESGPALAKALYYNAACPTPGMLGSGSRCRPCPRGGYCPGGERVRPLPGYWNPGEESGWVSECPLGDISCAGCRNDITGEDKECYRNASSACVPPYTGPLCGACAAGFYKTTAGSCLPCLSGGEVSAFLVGAVFMWGTLAVCSWRVRSHKVWSDIVEIVLALQEAAGVGAMIAQGLPPFASSWYRLLELVTGEPTFYRGTCEGLPKVSEQYLGSMGYALALGAPMWLFVVVFRRCVKARTPGYSVGGLITRGMITHGALQYYNVLSQSLSLVSCAKAGDGSLRLVAWPHVQCFRGSHIPAFAVAITLVVVVGVVAPVAYTAYLLKNSGRMYTDMSLISRFSLLYGGYKRRFRFFFVVEVLVMVALSIAKALLQAKFLLQISLIGAVLSLQVVVMVAIRPVHGRKQLFFVILCILTNIGALAVIYMANTKRLSERSSRVPILIIMALVALSLAGKILVVIWDATRDRRVFPGSKPGKWAALEGNESGGGGVDGDDGGANDHEQDGTEESLPSETDLLSPDIVARQGGRLRGVGPLPSDPGVTELFFPGSVAGAAGAAPGAAGAEASPSMLDTFMSFFGLGGGSGGGGGGGAAGPEEEAGAATGTATGNPDNATAAIAPPSSSSPSSLPLWRVHSIVPRPQGRRHAAAISNRPPRWLDLWQGPRGRHGPAWPGRAGAPRRHQPRRPHRGREGHAKRQRQLLAPRGCARDQAGGRPPVGGGLCPDSGPDAPPVRGSRGPAAQARDGCLLGGPDGPQQPPGPRPRGMPALPRHHGHRRGAHRPLRDARRAHGLDGALWPRGVPRRPQRQGRSVLHRGRRHRSLHPVPGQGAPGRALRRPEAAPKGPAPSALLHGLPGPLRAQPEVRFHPGRDRPPRQESVPQPPQGNGHL